MWKLWWTQLSVHILNNCWVQKGVLVSPFIVQLSWRNLLYFFSTKAPPPAPLVCWSCLLPSEVLNSVLPCGFQPLCLSTLTCKLLANRMAVTWIRPGGLCTWRDLCWGPCTWKDLYWGPCIWEDLCWSPCWVVSMCMRTSPGRATRRGEANQHPLVKSIHLY